MNSDNQSMTSLDMPLNTIIKLEPYSYQYKEERITLLNPITTGNELSTLMFLKKSNSLSKFSNNMRLNIIRET